MDPATRYAEQVLAGEIPAGKLVALACARHLRDLKRQGTAAFPWVWKPHPRGEAIEQFCGLLRHYKGEWAGHPLTLEPFQRFILFSVFCWVHPDTGLRRFRTAVIRVPRKNGKTTFAAAIALYLMALDGEPGAEVYAAATKRDQARLVFRDACTMLRRAHPRVRERFREKIAVLEFPSTDAKFEPLAADSEKLDGLNPHGAICDETHAWKSRDLWDVIDSGMGARRQPLMVDISTAGINTASFAYETHKRAEDILQGVFDDDAFFAYIAMADPDDLADWADPAVWRKANPGYGTIKSHDYLESQAAKVRATPSALTDFLTKQLNIWTNAEERWLDPNDWQRGNRPGLREALRGKPCFGALDLAKVSDLSAFALVFHPSVVNEAIGEEKHALLTWHWCPEQNLSIRARKDRVPYDAWERAGWIEKTPGNTTDFKFLRARIRALCDEYQVQDIAFDRWCASETVQGLMEDGMAMVEFIQGPRSYGPPTAELERLVISGDLLHEDNPLLAWEAGNVVIVRDDADNMRPSKSKSREKIDGIVAGIMALGRVMIAEPQQDAPLIWFM